MPNLAEYAVATAQAAYRQRVESSGSKLRNGCSLTQELLDTIAELGPVSTAFLCKELQIGSRQVWGLLKVPQALGKVQRSPEGLWAKSTLYEDRNALQREASAVEYLQSRGWACSPPSCSATSIKEKS